MNKGDWVYLSYVASVILVAVITTYMMATIGHPESVWLVCDMMGFEVCPIPE